MLTRYTTRSLSAVYYKFNIICPPAVSRRTITGRYTGRQVPLAHAAAAARAGSRPPGHIARSRSHLKEKAAMLYFVRDACAGVGLRAGPKSPGLRSLRRLDSGVWATLQDSDSARLKKAETPQDSDSARLRKAETPQDPDSARLRKAETPQDSDFAETPQ